MRYLLFICLSFFVSVHFAQRVAPFIDFNNFFKTFYRESFRAIDMQQIKSFKAGDELVAYIDIRGNLRVYDGENRKEITTQQVIYSVSDHLMTYQIGNTLNLWDANKLKTLTFNCGQYLVKDSLVIFQDLRYNALKVYYSDSIYELYSTPSVLEMPAEVGEDLIVFKDNGSFFKVFYKGTITDLGVWNGTIDVSAGTGVLCLNDPTTRTFAVFENNSFLDVEEFYMKKYKSGRGFIVYEDLNGNLIHYTNGTKRELSNFSPSFWEVKDDVVIWFENGALYGLQNGNIAKITTYNPKEYKLKNNSIAFRNLYGGVSALVDGKIQEITNVPDATFEIYGNVILVQLPNRSVIVYTQERRFEN